MVSTTFLRIPFLLAGSVRALKTTSVWALFVRHRYSVLKHQLRRVLVPRRLAAWIIYYLDEHEATISLSYAIHRHRGVYLFVCALKPDILRYVSGSDGMNAEYHIRPSIEYDFKSDLVRTMFSRSV